MVKRLKSNKFKFILALSVLGCLVFFLALSNYKAAATLPASLQFNVTFGHFKLSSDGTNWVTLVNSPVTVNLLSPTTTSTQGSTVTITAPPAGTYKYLGMSVTAMYFSMSGQQDRDIFPILKAQDGGQNDWNNMVCPIIPITYSGSGELSLNMYMPESNISGNSYETYFPENGPIFSFSGGSVSTASAGKIIVTVNGVAANSYVDAGIFSNIGKDAGPFTHAVLINNQNGTATGTAYVPAGSWYVMGLESNTPVGPSGPQVGAKNYTVGGVLPWEGTISPVTVAAGQSTAVTLSYAFTITSSMGAGGSGKKPSGTASINFTLQASPSATTLSGPTELMVYAFTSEAAAQGQGGPPDYFLGAKTVAAGSFSSTTLLASGLAAGSYVVVAFLDKSGDGRPTPGTDYFGMYGGFSNPTVINLAAGQTLDLTGSPINLSLFTGP